MLAAADPGFTLADPYAIGLTFAGIAVFAAIGALSHQQERAFSASVIYLAFGLAAAGGIELLGVGWLDPLKDAKLLERLTELAVVIALFGAGMKLDRPLNREAWAPIARLLGIAMPLTIAAVALFGVSAMGLSLGAAIALGALLAPTDPVLAGDIGVGPPGDEEERQPNFSVTGEAGLNDGLAYPFVLLAVLVAERGGAAWLGEWLAADVLYGVAVGAVVGGALGYGLAAMAVALRDRRLLAHELDGWLAIAAVLWVYGVCEVVGAYGFLGAFVGGVAFRRYEHGHEYNRRVHDGAEIVEKFGELALVLLLGSMVTVAGLQAPGVSGWLLVPLLLVVIRPLSVVVALVRSPMQAGERTFVAWFGVRGIGSLYYGAVLVGAGALAPGEEQTVIWTMLACVVVSIVVHGVSASPLGRRWLAEPEREREPERGRRARLARAGGG